MVSDLFVHCHSQKTQKQVREGNLNSCQSAQCSHSSGFPGIAQETIWGRRAPVGNSGLWTRLKTDATHLSVWTWSNKSRMWVRNQISSCERLKKSSCKTGHRNYFSNGYLFIIFLSSSIRREIWGMEEGKKWIFQLVMQAASQSRLMVSPGQGEQTSKDHRRRTKATCKHFPAPCWKVHGSQEEGSHDSLSGQVCLQVQPTSLKSLQNWTSPTKCFGSAESVLPMKTKMCWIIFPQFLLHDTDNQRVGQSLLPHANIYTISYRKHSMN